MIVSGLIFSSRKSTVDGHADLIVIIIHQKTRAQSINCNISFYLAEMMMVCSPILRNDLIS